MSFFTALKQCLTLQGQHERFASVYAKMNHGAPPPPNRKGPSAQYPLGAPTYTLNRWIIRKQGERAIVHLHGEHGKERRIEYVSVGIFQGETDADIVRCAATMSPTGWEVPLSINTKHFKGMFYAPLSEGLRTTLGDPSQISVSLHA